MPQRIVHISPVYPPYAGGIGVVAYMMAEGLAGRGMDVVAATPIVSEKGTEARRHTVIKLKPLIKIGNAAVVSQLRKLEGYDIIHLHYPFFGGAEWLLFNKSINQESKKTKLVLQYHHDADAGGSKGAIFKLYDKIFLPRLIKFADKVVVSSMDYARHSRVAKFINNKFVEMPFGVDTERFSPRDSRFELPDSKFTILFVGSLDRAHWFKGLGVLLEALAEVKEKIGKNAASLPHWQCTIVGDGDIRPGFEQKARALGVANHVQFLGTVPHEQLPDAYRTADLFVFPSVSRAEAFGLVVLEAMASGLSVIVSDLPGVRILTNCHPEPDEGCGYTFPVGDSSKLAELILNIMQDVSLCARKGSVARERVVAHYTVDSMIDKLTHLYENLAH